MKITILYNGKPYKPDPLSADLLTVAIDGLVDTIKEGLKPFMKDIEKEGGEATINVTGDLNKRLNAKSKINGISDGLAKRIKDSIHGD